MVLPISSVFRFFARRAKKRKTKRRKSTAAIDRIWSPRKSCKVKEYDRPSSKEYDRPSSLANKRIDHALPATHPPLPPLSGAARVLCTGVLQHARGRNSGRACAARTPGIVYLSGLESVSGLGALRMELVGCVDPAAPPARLVAAAATRRA